MDKKARMQSMTGRGRELAEMLRKELGVPEDCVSFEVRFAVGETVTVKCEYRPHVIVAENG